MKSEILSAVGELVVAARAQCVEALTCATSDAAIPARVVAGRWSILLGISRHEGGVQHWHLSARLIPGHSHRDDWRDLGEILAYVSSASGWDEPTPPPPLVSLDDSPPDAVQHFIWHSDKSPIDEAVLEKARGYLHGIRSDAVSSVLRLFGLIANAEAYLLASVVGGPYAAENRRKGLAQLDRARQAATVAEVPDVRAALDGLVDGFQGATGEILQALCNNLREIRVDARERLDAATDAAGLPRIPTGVVVGDHAAGPAGPVRRTQPKVGRNQPCPCGSGRKYKRCHGAN